MDAGSVFRNSASPYFKNSLIEIVYESPKGIAQVHWKGPYSSTAFREALQECLKLNKTKHVGKWIGFNINLSSISTEDQEWTASQLLPKFKVSLLQKIGLILTKDLYTKMVVESTLEKCSLRGSFEFQFFDDLSTALSWMEEE